MSAQGSVAGGAADFSPQRHEPRCLGHWMGAMMLIAADVRRPSTVTEEEPGSVSDTLQDFTWDSDETAAYETAVEVINAAIGAYSREIASKRPRPPRTKPSSPPSGPTKPSSYRSSGGSTPKTTTRSRRHDNGSLDWPVRLRSGPATFERRRGSVPAPRRPEPPHLSRGHRSPTEGHPGPQARPTVVFLIGQPGAGKARAGMRSGRPCAGPAPPGGTATRRVAPPRPRGGRDG